MNDSLSLQVAAITLAISFLAAWMLNSAQARIYTSTMHWYNAFIYMMPILAMVIGIHAYARGKTSQRIRHGAVSALSGLITQCNALDQIARLALGLIQEVEIVSRGYEM
jgi:Mysoin-binding motif of peroxisomes